MKYLTARFVRTLGMLLHSGVPIMSALKIARAAISNSAVAQAVDAAAAAVSEGSAVATALEGTIAPMAVQMLAVGEESGKLEETCARIADTFDRDVRRTMRSAVAMIEPVLILVFGLLVGFVALAMLQAIYSINAGAF
jgi:type II secretory pathway component PulF